MNSPIFILFVAQLIFSIKDLLGRSLVRNHKFGTAILHRPVFYLLLVMHFTGYILQLYVLSNFQLSRAMTGFAVLSILFATVSGWLFLGETISTVMYFALVLAFASFLLLAFAVK